MHKTTVLKNALRPFFTRGAGFTLIEVLVVVLIIGILAGFALPWYERAIFKSRFHTAIPNTRSIAEAQEVYFIAQGKYATAASDLDIENAGGDNPIEVTIGTEEKYKFVRGYNKKAPSARYVIYQVHSTNFPGNIHCEAERGNEMAEWLCEEELQGVKIPHGSLDGDEFVTYILQGDAGDGTFSQTYIDEPTAPLTNGDVCLAQHAEGCSNTSFTESSCEGNQTAGCQHSTFNDSTCNGNAGGNSAGTTVCGHNIYNNSECHGEEGNNGYVCGRSDYNHNSACYSNSHGGCGHSSFENGSVCYAREGTACQTSEFTDSSCVVESGGGCNNNSTFSNSTCTVEAGGGCTGNMFSNGSVCHTSVGGTSSNRACGTGSTYDHSTCYNDSSTSYLGCGQGTYTNESVCHSSSRGGCGRATFDGNSVCYGNGDGACGTCTYTNHSVCYANASGACNNNTYKSGSYCSGSFCPAGSPRQDGTIRTEVGE